MNYQTALAEALKASGMRVEEAAVKSGVSFSTIINIRNGHSRNPSRLVVEALKREIPGFADILDRQQTAAA